jgi:predicted phosphohydrolase
MYTLAGSELGSSVPGVDVMITIFSDFWQISANKLAFFSKPNVVIKILHNLFVLSQNAIFC